MNVVKGRSTKSDDRVDKPGRLFALRNQVNYHLVNTKR